MSHPSTPQGLALDEYTDTSRDTHFGTPPDDGEIIFNTTQRTIQFSLDGEWHSVVIFAGTPVEGQMFTYTAGTNRLRPEGVLPSSLLGLVDLAANVTGALPIANGGSGQATQQAAIDALSAVSGATDEHVLTKDTVTGNAIFKAAAGGGGANHDILDGSVHQDSVVDGVTRGSIIIGNSTPKWDELVVPATPGALTSDGTDVAWKAAKRTLVLTAAGITPNKTQGCTPPVRVEGGNGANYVVADFASGEEGSWVGIWPDNYDGGTVTFQYHWVAPTGASASDTVIFGLKGISYANDLAIDTALGTQVTVTDTVIAVGDVHISAESAAVTLAQGPAGGEPFILEIERTGGTMSEEARLLAVRISYTTDAYSDE